LIAKRFDVAHQECAYVADNPSKDFVAPNALGWLTVQVTRGDGIYLNALVADAGAADHLITTLDELDCLLR
jgi:putative hydrolase of the HAD superfamily